ncbi:class I SAM-dependent methyltransferase [Bombilactobacillus folatiphilus]|uniref:Class I SAM-dependent methyltransferase n=1 Tax=Bombilactobacillus folatiphilus TaxID=2923362 RepID=A0ABY4PA46_9LACO|nr:class I SAM-dependent methyltransferase [Bombilactobacillus folatiphilus]UQS82499.1 class I SAM-dependent methyltransferase [Bombilactobacillus folatiphilus]
MNEVQARIQQIYQFVDQTTTELKQDLRVSYQDALSENILNILGQTTFVEDGFPNEEQAAHLNQQYQNFDLKSFTRHEIKKALELSIIKAQRLDKVDVNHLMTPDIIGTICSLVIIEIFQAYPKPKLQVVDPAVGTGNFLFQIAQDLKQDMNLSLQLYGLDNDDQMLMLTDAFSQAIGIEIDLYHQDAVADWLLQDFDLILSDLPVGYYPLDENTTNFKTKSEKGHSYAHHLIIEQAMKYVQPGGLGVFVVPSQIFQTDQAKSLAEWMVKDVYLQAVLSLSNDLFASLEAAKSIVVLQRHGQNAKQSPQVLMGQIPSLDRSAEMAQFKRQLQIWSQNTFNWG